MKQTFIGITLGFALFSLVAQGSAVQLETKFPLVSGRKLVNITKFRLVPGSGYNTTGGGDERVAMSIQQDPSTLVTQHWMPAYTRAKEWLQGTIFNITSNSVLVGSRYVAATTVAGSSDEFQASFSSANFPDIIVDTDSRGLGGGGVAPVCTTSAPYCKLAYATWTSGTCPEWNPVDYANDYPTYVDSLHIGNGSNSFRAQMGYFRRHFVASQENWCACVTASNNGWWSDPQAVCTIRPADIIVTDQSVTASTTGGVGTVSGYVTIKNFTGSTQTGAFALEHQRPVDNLSSWTWTSGCGGSGNGVTLTNGSSCTAYFTANYSGPATTHYFNFTARWWVSGHSPESNYMPIVFN